jgi:hypothetical protein
MTTTIELTSVSAVFDQFYRVPRAGAVRLSDGGGPFGFDITVAIQVEHLVTALDCDGIIETGCFLGDTTEYLARRYPHLPIRTCDIEPQAAEFTRQRLAGMGNVTVLTGDSAALLGQLAHGLRRPLYYLDAHWYEQWPLSAELASISVGVVCIDDFDIGHPRFGYDTYQGRPCDPHLVAAALPDLAAMWVGNPFFDYTVPCLQTGRRAGTGYLLRGLPGSIDHPMFTPVPLRPVRLPQWPDVDHDRSES